MSLVCDNFQICKSELVERDTWAETEAYARARGWHLYRGLNLTGGRSLMKSLCDKCMHTTRSRAPERLDGEVPLFEVPDPPDVKRDNL